MPNNLDLTSIQAVLSDMDGVLWRGDTPLPGFHNFFDFLQNRAIPFILVTNNAGKTLTQYLQRFSGLGVHLRPENILTSAIATAIYLRQELPTGAKLYVIGEAGLQEAMREAEFSLVDNAPTVDAVVAGIDRELTYQKLKQATLLIQRGARFIGSNGDLSFPTEDGLAPGAGAILAALQAATGVAPTIIGKPKRLMFDIAVQKIGCDRAQTVMIGDRFDTDILGGQGAGLKTIFVTTGVDNEESIRHKEIPPDAIFSGLEELIRVWQTHEVKESKV